MEIIQHPNVRAIEYRFPVVVEEVTNCPDWMKEILPDWKSAISARWRDVPPIAVPLVDWFLGLQARAVADVDGQFFLAIQAPNGNSTIFLPELCDKTDAGVPDVVTKCLAPFRGVVTGPRFIPCGGFAQDFRVFDFDEEEVPWEDHDDTEWDGSVAFYDTTCGNIFCLNEDGRIAKWDHESNEFRTAFSDLSEFFAEFMRFLTVSNPSRSPFFM